MTTSSNPSPARDGDAQTLDAVIVGGGVAGLWLANLLTARGYAIVVLEADTLGGGQTLASQGMVHGGIKYALGGALTGASEAIAGMPERWRRCLAGNGDIDLHDLRPLSPSYYLFAAGSARNKLTAFLASRALRGRILRLERVDYPPALRHPRFHGVVYALNDFVVDTRELMRTLAAAVAGHTYRHRLLADGLRLCDDGVQLEVGGTRLSTRRLILTAGAGTAALLDGLGLDGPRMQLRPLQQVVVRHDYPHPLYAHCLTGIRRAEPRLTITSHPDGDGWVWYLGGQLATDGVDMTPDALVDHARRELETCLPWIPWNGAEFSTLVADRAEPEQDGGRRPDQAFAATRGPVVVAWPTKLSLVPDLGDRVLDLLPPPSGRPPPALHLPGCDVGRFPWSA